MPFDRPPLLCRLCRGLNLRVETSVDRERRWPTSLAYESTDDILDNGNGTDRHYVPGESLKGDGDYTVEELSRRLESLAYKPEFDEDGILVSARPVRKKVLGTLGDIRVRAVTCMLYNLVVEASKVVQRSAKMGSDCDSL
jgi:hypothetical protein